MHDIVENAVVVALLKKPHCLHEGTDRLWLTNAWEDRLKTEAKIEAGFSKSITAIVKDMVRSTSVLNFLMNTCLFLAAMSALLAALPKQPETQPTP